MEKNVLLSVNGQESKLSFIDHPHGDQEVSKFQGTRNMWSRDVLFECHRAVFPFCLAVRPVRSLSTLK